MKLYVDQESFQADLSSLKNSVGGIGDADGGMRSMINSAISFSSGLQGIAIESYMNELSTLGTMIQNYYNLLMEDCGHIQNMSDLHTQLDQQMATQVKANH